ncbi:hypothetical protein CFP56_025832 [Quercus suber]|uniref:Uncharacterized protein n=1 Tax=Quercus suber TaxID=58331 RepID=A0AAW0K423_QUESU
MMIMEWSRKAKKDKVGLKGRPLAEAVEGAGLNKLREILMHVVIKVLGKAAAQYILRFCPLYELKLWTIYKLLCWTSRLDEDLQVNLLNIIT